METVVSPPTQDGPELHLLTQWESLEDSGRLRRAGVYSVVLHIAAIVTLALLPRSFLTVEPHRTSSQRLIMPLLAPPSEPTQTTPNKGKLSKEFDAEMLAPRPRIQVPPSPPSTTRPAAPRLSFSAPSAIPRPAPAAVPEPPRMEAQAAQAPQIPAGPPIAPLQIQPQEQPKLAFETPAAQPPQPTRPTGRVPVPGSTVSDALRSVVRGGASGGLTMGDDISETGIGGLGRGINLPPSPGKQGSNLELLSDPMGVDFRPYLIKILAAVRRNWFAVMPESAKLGRRGRVSIQFAIARGGSVPKLVIVMPSGTEALDRAAVAGISASNPFPPLPPEFKGEQVRLQFNFAYNMK